MKTKALFSAFIGVHLRLSAANSFFDLELDLAELVETLFTNYPLGGFQRAPGEAFAAARGVAERDGVGRAIEADLVGAGYRAGAICAHVDMARIACLFHL